MGLSQIKGWSRSRWTAFGAVVAVCLGSGGVMTASATLESGEKSVFVPITPCRVMDTRAAPRGRPRNSHWRGRDVQHRATGRARQLHHSARRGRLSMNHSRQPTGASFLTVFPTGAAQPVASNLNYVAGQAPVPNAVEVKIGAGGKISFYNNTGTVDVAADIVGYYVDHNHNDLYYTKEEVDAA